MRNYKEIYKEMEASVAKTGSPMESMAALLVFMDERIKELESSLAKHTEKPTQEDG